MMMRGGGGKRVYRRDERKERVLIDGKGKGKLC